MIRERDFVDLADTWINLYGQDAVAKLRNWAGDPDLEDDARLLVEGAARIAEQRLESRKTGE